MKFLLSLTLMLALGLSASHGFDDVIRFDPASVMEQLEVMSNQEIVDVDDALEKARALKSMARLIAEAEMSAMMGVHKRFLGDFFEKLGNTFKDTAHKVGEFFTDTWNKAKSAFEKATSNIDFESVVQKALPYIHSGMTTAACKKAISSAATAILGPAAALVGTVASPVCSAALAKLQDIAG